jgi:hypothetical protein
MGRTSNSLQNFAFAKYSRLAHRPSGNFSKGHLPQPDSNRSHPAYATHPPVKSQGLCAVQKTRGRFRKRCRNPRSPMNPVMLCKCTMSSAPISISGFQICLRRNERTVPRERRWIAPLNAQSNLPITRPLKPVGGKRLPSSKQSTLLSTLLRRNASLKREA